MHPDLDNLWKIDTRLPAEKAPQEAREFWAENMNNSSATPILIKGKLPFAIYWSGPTFNEFLVEGDR